jgi:hypothetical protein
MAETKASNIKQSNVNLPTPGHKGKKLAFTLPFLTPDECKRFIEFGESLGYKPALVNLGLSLNGDQVYELAPDVRNNTETIVFDKTFGENFWSRLKPFVPATWRGLKVVGLNERLRYIRYDAGERFMPHEDGSCFCAETGERSFITVHIYLNDDFEGGNTTFLDSTKYPDLSASVGVVPKQGTALIFEHGLLHMGSTVTKGRKYCLRCDVMYAPVKTTDPVLELPSAYHPLTAKSKREYISYLIPVKVDAKLKQAESKSTTLVVLDMNASIIKSATMSDGTAACQNSTSATTLPEGKDQEKSANNGSSACLKTADYRC